MAPGLSVFDPGPDCPGNLHRDCCRLCGVPVVPQGEPVYQQLHLYRESLHQLSPADLSAEVKNTLDTLRADGLKLAIGSSSKNTKFILGQLGLGDYFDAVSDGNNITRSKPDPEVFLKAAQMVGLAPADCLVVEDAVSGAQAGHAGGFDVACVGDASKAGAGDYNMDSFGELTRIVTGG